MKTITNLRALLGYFQILNRDLGQAINVSPSLISKRRALRMPSGSAAAIADFLLSKRFLTSRDIVWLKKHFEQSGISADFDSVSDIKRNMIVGLAETDKMFFPFLRKRRISAWPQIKHFSYG